MIYEDSFDSYIQEYGNLNFKDYDVIKQKGDQYCVKTSEQIHILGNFNDIESFKKYLNK